MHSTNDLHILRDDYRHKFSYIDTKKKKGGMFVFSLWWEFLGSTLLAVLKYTREQKHRTYLKKDAVI